MDWINFLSNFNYAYKVIVDVAFHEDIYNFIENNFVSLETEHKKILSNSLVVLIDVIYLYFRIMNKDTYLASFKNNDYFNTKSLIMLLLPTIKNNMIRKITSFDELFTAKNKIGNIEKEEVSYKYSDMQYQIINRDTREEVKYTLKTYVDNFLLLIDTIIVVQEKLYVNWINVFPMDYKNIQEILETFKRNLEKGNIEDENINTIYDILKTGKKPTNINDFYNIIRNRLYDSNIEWLLIDVNCIISNKETYLSFIEILDLILGLSNAILDKSYNQNEKRYLISFNSNFNKLKEIYRSKSMFKNNELEIYGGNLQYCLNRLNNSFKKTYRNIEKAKEEGYDKSFESIQPFHFYEFIRVILQKLRHNGFYRNLYDMKNLHITYRPKITLEESTETTTGNFISLYHIYLFSKYVCSKVIDSKISIMEKNWKSLSNDDKKLFLDRFNKTDVTIIPLSIELRKFFRNKSKGFYSNLNTKIWEQCKENIVMFVYQSLSFDGLLSMIDTTYHEKKLSIPKELLKQTYFITGDRYYEIINKQRVDKYYTDKIYDGKMCPDMFEFAINQSRPWYNSYILNWATQIGFYLHYINNRVMFVTGATGIGKSTQIPKLLLYSLKMIDYKDDGSIVCSEPKQQPTRQTAERISDELGVPIKKDFRYIQYKFRGEEKYSEIVRYNHIKFVTDGILEKEVHNPYMKWKVENKYTNANIYDIIIVDESHEHNKNMDITLTLLQHSLFYNNNLRLIIMSATMDYDEKIYRRFFRDINDNKKFPLNNEIQSYNIDRINVDRRFNITTFDNKDPFKITENYVPNKDLDKIILDIIKKDAINDILLFEPGHNDIIKTVKKINKNVNIPFKTIALPFHSKMTTEQKEIISKINELKKKLNISKNEDFELSEQPCVTYEVNKYEQVIIVATNIAEAAITIPSLKYVIDIGKSKVLFYNPYSGKSILQLTDISETSRIQRRGRVGRTTDGYVYYLYEKNDKINNKINYNISSSDLTENILRLKKIDNNEFIDIDINNINDLDLTIIDKNITKLFENQYYLNGKFYNYNGLGTYKNIIHKRTDEVFEDKLGKFYIIHPDELYIKRNTFGEIVSIEKNDFGIKIIDNKIDSIKIKSFLNNLINHKLIDLDGNINELGEFVLFLMDEMGTMFDNIYFVITFIYSIKFKCTLNFLYMMAIIKGLENNLANLCNTEHKFMSIKDVFGKKSTSDIETIINLVKDFELLLNEKFTSCLSLKSEHMKKFIFKNKNIKNNENTNLQRKNNLLEISTDKVTRLDTYNTCKDRKLMLDYLNECQFIPIFDTWNYKTYIKSYKPLFKIIKEFLLCKAEYYKLEYGLTKNIRGIYIDNIIRKIEVIKTSQNINSAVLQGFSQNVIKYIDNTDKYLMMYNLDKQNICSIGINMFMKNVFLLNDLYIYNNLIFLSYDAENDLASILFSIKNEDILKINYFKTKEYKKKLQEQLKVSSISNINVHKTIMKFLSLI